MHGGAWAIPREETDAHLDGLGRALARARQLAERGWSAMEIVVETVAVLEAHPAFDAGVGAVLDRDGRPQLDAGVMDGQSMAWGAVANVRTVAHPVRLAARVAEGDGQARLLVGEGAERFAAELGMPHVEPERLIVARERARYERLLEEQGFHTSRAFSGEAPRGTVGCVALDADGRLAAATSTGGAPFTRPGRVGDSPIVGSGFWADGHAALSATGWGEAISTVQLCARAGAEIERGLAPHEAAQQRLDAMREIVRWPGATAATGGLIALDRTGRGGWAFTTPRMARGGWTPEGGAWTSLDA
ncbi:MAG: isoaspartyl peptidase/L-asparaginase [Bacteroidota bacterium]